MLLNIIAVFIGGGLGATLRYFASCLAKKYFISPITGTFFVNIAGCFLIGYIFGLTINKVNIMPQTIKLFLTAGILGGLTTFSTLNLEIFELIKTGKPSYGILYMLLSSLAGLLFTFAGYYLSQLNIKI